MLSAICEYCSKPFEYRNKNRKGETRRFCSHKCYSLSLKGKINAERITQICPTCGKEFERIKSHLNRPGRINARRHCSFKCARPSIDAANIKHSKVTCKSCGKEFHPRTNKGKLSEFCSKKCFGASYRAAQSIIDSQQNGEPTSIEQKMIGCLDEHGLEYRFQYPIYGSDGLKRFICDFAFPDSMLIVEADGDYWHSLPKMISSDKRKNAYLKNHGYTLLRFTETQINQDVNACVQLVISHLQCS